MIETETRHSAMFSIYNLGIVASCGFVYIRSFVCFALYYAKISGTGWFTTDPFEITKKFGGQWKTTHFKAGDVLIFSMKTVHMSTANLTDLVRISCDTRWQPAEEPADPRYVGEFKRPEKLFGLYHEDGKKPTEVTIEELKEQWGLQ